jgi:hypothetical protein
MLSERKGGEEMNKKVLGIIIALMAVTTLSTTISVVFATKPTHVEGTWKIDTGTVYKDPAGNSDTLIETHEDIITLTGDIEGTGDYDRRLVFHNYSPSPPWQVTQQGIITIEEAKVGEMTGTLVISTVANSQKSPDGQWTIIGGTEELVNLHGQGTFSHVTPLLFKYEGQVHFDP